MKPCLCKIILAIWVYTLPFVAIAANTTGEKQTTLDVCLIDNELFPLWRKPGDEHKSRGGINIDLMRYVAAQTNLKIHWVRAPFPRCLKLLQSGEVDALNMLLAGRVSMVVTNSHNGAKVRRCAMRQLKNLVLMS